MPGLTTALSHDTNAQESNSEKHPTSFHQSKHDADPSIDSKHGKLPTDPTVHRAVNGFDRTMDGLDVKMDVALNADSLAQLIRGLTAGLDHRMAEQRLLPVFHRLKQLLDGCAGRSQRDLETLTSLKDALTRIFDTVFGQKETSQDLGGTLAQDCAAGQVNGAIQANGQQDSNFNVENAFRQLYKDVLHLYEVTKHRISHSVDPSNHVSNQHPSQYPTLQLDSIPAPDARHEMHEVRTAPSSPQPLRSAATTPSYLGNGNPPSSGCPTEDDTTSDLTFAEQDVNLHSASVEVPVDMPRNHDKNDKFNHDELSRSELHVAEVLAGWVSMDTSDRSSTDSTSRHESYDTRHEAYDSRHQVQPYIPTYDTYDAHREPQPLPMHHPMPMPMPMSLPMQPPMQPMYPILPPAGNIHYTNLQGGMFHPGHHGQMLPGYYYPFGPTYEYGLNGGLNGAAELPALGLDQALEIEHGEHDHVKEEHLQHVEEPHYPQQEDEYEDEDEDEKRQQKQQQEEEDYFDYSAYSHEQTAPLEEEGYLTRITKRPLKRDTSEEFELDDDEDDDYTYGSRTSKRRKTSSAGSSGGTSRRKSSTSSTKSSTKSSVKSESTTSATTSTATKSSSKSPSTSKPSTSTKPTRTQTSRLHPSRPSHENPTARRRRPNFPPEIRRILVEQYEINPHPSAEDKDRLCEETGLSRTQLMDWFINERRRNHSKGEQRNRYLGVDTSSSASNKKKKTRK